jgi:sulfur carrier protein
MTAETIAITLNGEPAAVPAGASIVDLLRQRGRDPEQGGVAVAVNATVIRRAAWPATPLAEGDQVEVITAFQGG